MLGITCVRRSNLDASNAGRREACKFLHLHNSLDCCYGNSIVAIHADFVDRERSAWKCLQLPHSTTHSSQATAISASAATGGDNFLAVNIVTQLFSHTRIHSSTLQHYARDLLTAGEISAVTRHRHRHLFQ